MSGIWYIDHTTEPTTTTSFNCVELIAGTRKSCPAHHTSTQNNNIVNSFVIYALFLLENLYIIT